MGKTKKSKHVRVQYKKTGEASTVPTALIRVKGDDGKFVPYVPCDEDISKMFYVSQECKDSTCGILEPHTHNYLATILSLGDTPENIVAKTAEQCQKPSGGKASSSKLSSLPTTTQAMGRERPSGSEQKSGPNKQDAIKGVTGYNKTYQKYLENEKNQFDDSDQDFEDGIRSNVVVQKICESDDDADENEDSHLNTSGKLPKQPKQRIRPRINKRKSRDSYDAKGTKRRRQTGSDWVCLENSTDLGFLQTFMGGDGKTVRIHLGLGIKKDNEVWIKALRVKEDTRLLRILIYFVCTPIEIINSNVEDINDLHDWEGQEPRKKVEKEKVELVKDLFKYILKDRGVSMRGTYTRLTPLNSILTRVIQDVRKMKEFKNWKPIPRKSQDA